MQTGKNKIVHSYLRALLQCPSKELWYLSLILEIGRLTNVFGVQSLKVSFEFQKFKPNIKNKVKLYHPR